MLATSSLIKLIRYSRWACDRLYKAVLNGPKPSVDSSVDDVSEKIVDTLGHIFIVDQIWKAHLLGHIHGFSQRRFERAPDLAQLRLDQSNVNNWFVGYVDELSEVQHNEPIRFTFISGAVGTMTRHEMLLHVINHRTYH